MSPCRTKGRTAVLATLLVVLAVSFVGIQALADAFPWITGCPADQTGVNALNNDLGVCGAVATWTEPLAHDDVGVTSFTSDWKSGDVFPIGTTLVTYTAVDTVGQVTLCTFSIEVLDAEPPTALCKDITVDIGLTGSHVLTAAEIDNGSGDNCAFTLSIPSTTLTCADIGSPVIVPLTITDAAPASNTDTCNATVTVVDTVAPTISTPCPGNIAVNNDPSAPPVYYCYATVSWTPPAWNDACSPVVVTSNWSPGDLFPIGVTTVTYTATDPSGNTDSCSFTVTVTDNENPWITAPADVGPVSVDTGECYATGIVLGTPTFGDNCTGGLGPWYSNDAPSEFPVSTTVVTWTVTDGSGNTGTDTQNVTVVDDEKPTITCPADITQTADPGFCSAVVNFTLPAGDDNCGVLSVVAVPASGSAFVVGTTPVTITVTDTATPANTESCTFNVIVTDDEDPTITAPLDVTDVTDTDQCYATGVVLGSPVASNDNCSGSIVTNDAPTQFPLGPTTVTWTITDAAGNTATDTQLVTITDGQAPVITACPPPVTVSVDPGLCSASGVGIGLISPTWTDNCPGAVATHNSPAVITMAMSPHTIIWTITDVGGNTATCTVAVTVVDDEAPTVTCPADITQSNDAGMCDAVVNFTLPTGADNCGVASVVASPASGSTFTVAGSPHTVTVTVTDTATVPNVTTCTFTVTVTDDEDPTITAPGDVAVNTDANECYASSVGLGTPTSNDNCPSAIVTNNAPLLFPVGITTVTWTITDAAGNTATDTQLVTVTDAQFPALSGCPTDQSISVDPGQCGAVATWADPVVTENCSIAYFDSDFPSGYFFPVGATLVTYTATDASGNSSTCDFTITVTDDENPVARCKDITVALDATGNYSLLPAEVNDSSSDNCMAGLVLSVSPSAFDCTDLGDQTVTLTATDAATNSDTCTATVTVIDDIAPVITSCPADQMVMNDPGLCGAVVTWLPGSAWDACGVVITVDFASGSFFPVGTTTVTMTATDGSGNTATCTFDITVEDTEDPVITCPTNIDEFVDAGKCGRFVTLIPATATDNCGIIASIDHDWPGGDFPTGITSVTWTATDIHGNSATCVQLVDIDDNEPPVAACQDFELELDATGNAKLLASDIDDGSYDHCGIVVWTLSEEDFDCTDIAGSPHAVTLAVYDAEGNADSCVANVTVVDKRAPVFTGCPSDQLITLAPGSCSSTATWTAPTVNDNCGVLADYVWSHNPGDTFTVGTTTVTYTATDPYGNVGTCSFDITVKEVVPPVFTYCPVPVTVNNDPGECFATGVVLGTPIVTDDCDPAPTVTNNAPAEFDVGPTIVTWLAIDTSGNTATCTQTVTVIDNQAPVISGCPADIAVNNDLGVCGAVVSWTAPTAADNCSIASFVSTHAPGDTFPEGTTAVTYTATDTAGLTATCTFNVTVTDNEAPVISGCPADIAVNNDLGVCEAVVSWTAPTAADNCSIASFVSTHAPGDTFPEGTTAVTYTATDTAGLTATCTFNVTVTDAELPVISGCPADIAVYTEAGLCSAVVSWTAPTAADNCSIASFVSSHAPGDTFSLGGTTVTYTATDTAGLTATCTFNVTVIDNEAPVITCPADIAVNTDPGLCTAVVALIDATAVDNCDPAPVITNDAPAAFDKGVTIVTWTATDAAGNWMTCQQTVTVTDVEPPVLVCPVDVTVGLPIGASYIDGAAVSLGAPTATDNCALVSVTNNAPGSYPPGMTTITWTALDTSGNVSICEQTVNVTGQPVVFAPRSTFGSYLELEAPDPEQFFNDIELAAVIPLGEVVNGVFGLIGASFSDVVDGVRVELIEVTGTVGAEIYHHIGFVWAAYSAAEDEYTFAMSTTGIDPLVMLETGMFAPFDLLPGAYDIFVRLELPGGMYVSPRIRILITP